MPIMVAKSSAPRPRNFFRTTKNAINMPTSPAIGVAMMDNCVVSFMALEP